MVAIVDGIVSSHFLSVCHPRRIQNANIVPKNANPKSEPTDHRSVMHWAVLMARNKKRNSHPADVRAFAVPGVMDSMLSWGKAILSRYSAFPTQIRFPN
jgi:hypothetical protein